MASEGMGLVPPQRLDNGLTPQLVFQDEGLRFGRVGDPGPKTRELTGFIDDRYFQPQSSSDFRRCIYGSDHRTGRSGDGSEGDEEEEEDDDEDEEDDDVDERDGEVEALVAVDDTNNRNNNDNSNSEHGNGDAIGNGKSKHLSYVGASRGFMSKQGNFLQPGNDNSVVRANSNDDNQRGPVSQYQNAVTIADPDGDLYYSQYLQGPEGSGCGGEGRRVLRCAIVNLNSLGVECGLWSELVWRHNHYFGVLMDDAMILPCGHSFGGGGMQHVIRMKACYTCSRPVSEESVLPNLSLRAAVQAFRREEELQVYRSSKRRRERFEQDKGSFVDSMPMDHPRGRGVQFPFAVTDRVIIKGNKRTPQRFVGREAIVTTQCLNGWYVVKTLDNAESVKLQYRSLAKVSDNPSLKPAASKMTPNWL
ncbi:RING/U-box superfamily protein [Actinidia rufa]|uniref:RING/U-box superfamily protein n=1 Tax=Actinidia rufa TaxID=165716 RepID=A0A7J0GWA7_9ERIC|nr:RING/U-box superfamily protein [Actinidia rufa]